MKPKRRHWNIARRGGRPRYDLKLAVEPHEKKIIEHIVNRMALDMVQFGRQMAMHYLHSGDHDPAMKKLIAEAKALYGEISPVGVNVE